MAKLPNAVEILPKPPE